MYPLTRKLLFIGLFLSLTPALADGDAMEATRDLVVSFKMLNEQGETATQFAQGSEALFRIELNNPTMEDIRTSYTAPGYEISVYAPDSETALWQSHGETMFMQMLQEYVIEAGATRHLEQRWALTDMDGNPLPPGRYVARARVNIGMIGALAPHSFTITE